MPAYRIVSYLCFAFLTSCLSGCLSHLFASPPVWHRHVDPGTGTPFVVYTCCYSYDLIHIRHVLRCSFHRYAIGMCSCSHNLGSHDWQSGVLQSEVPGAVMLVLHSCLPQRLRMISHEGSPTRGSNMARALLQRPTMLQSCAGQRSTGPSVYNPTDRNARRPWCRRMDHVH